MVIMIWMKKKTNLSPGTENNHALTKKQVTDLIASNGGTGQVVDLTDYVEKDVSTGGFKADLPMNNNKITNLKEGTDNQDGDTVHQLANTAALKADKTQLNNYLKLDGSLVVKGHLQMDFNRIQDVANPRENKADAVPYVYFNNFYFKYDENNGKIDFQSPIDMQNKRMTNIQDPPYNQKDSMSYDFFTRRYFKPGQNNDITQVVILIMINS